MFPTFPFQLFLQILCRGQERTACRCRCTTRHIDCHSIERIHTFGLFKSYQFHIYVVREKTNTGRVEGRWVARNRDISRASPPFAAFWRQRLAQAVRCTRPTNLGTMWTSLSGEKFAACLQLILPAFQRRFGMQVEDVRRSGVVMLVKSRNSNYSLPASRRRRRDSTLSKSHLEIAHVHVQCRMSLQRRHASDK